MFTWIQFELEIEWWPVYFNLLFRIFVSYVLLFSFFLLFLVLLNVFKFIRIQTHFIQRRSCLLGVFLFWFSCEYCFIYLFSLIFINRLAVVLSLAWHQHYLWIKKWIKNKNKMKSLAIIVTNVKTTKWIFNWFNLILTHNLAKNWCKCVSLCICVSVIFRHFDVICLFIWNRKHSKCITILKSFLFKLPSVWKLACISLSKALIFFNLDLFAPITVYFKIVIIHNFGRGRRTRTRRRRRTRREKNKWDKQQQQTNSISFNKITVTLCAVDLKSLWKIAKIDTWQTSTSEIKLKTSNQT